VRSLNDFLLARSTEIARVPTVAELAERNRVWDLRDELTAYHATYLALAEALDCELPTGDAALVERGRGRARLYDQ
jgi:predicted nucleic acid-binding protein